MAEDPRNDDDFDTWEYGTEPLPGDQTWSAAVLQMQRAGDNGVADFSQSAAVIQLHQAGDNGVAQMSQNDVNKKPRCSKPGSGPSAHLRGYDVPPRSNLPDM